MTLLDGNSIRRKQMRLCGLCNRPRVGKGWLPLPDGKPSQARIAVCEEHRDKVVDFTLDEKKV